MTQDAFDDLPFVDGAQRFAFPVSTWDTATDWLPTPSWSARAQEPSRPDRGKAAGWTTGAV